MNHLGTKEGSLQIMVKSHNTSKLDDYVALDG